MAQQNQTDVHLEALVSTALAQSALSGLSEMLKSVAESVEAYGAILWEVAPGSEVDRGLRSGYLFVLAQWFQDKQTCVFYNLPLDSSVTGEAVLNQKPVNIPDIWKDERVYKGHPFLKKAAIKTMCSVPICFLDGTRGAVSLYRKDHKAFKEKEVLQIEKLASLIPAFYQSVRDKVSFSLIRDVNELIQKAELREPDTLPSKDEMKELFQEICNLVTDTFQCIETSIFMEDPSETLGVYKLMATTWPGSLTKVSHEKDPKDGLIGWLLTHTKPLRIFDLAYFERDKEMIRQRYPGLTWTDYVGIKSFARGFFKLGSEDELPPLSFMAVQIRIGEKVLGAIRCCITRTSPYYFPERELNLLKLIATQISYYWKTWLSRREVQEENRAWQNLVENISRLNRFVRTELSYEEPRERRIFSKALEVTSSVLRGAEILDIRLLDAETRELYFAETYGKPWNKGSYEEIQKRKQHRFPVGDKSPKSAGAHVFQTDRLYVISDVQQDPYYIEIFSDTKSMIIAPIKVMDQVFGVLDIRRTRKSAFSQQDRVIAMLLGRQLGLYHYLVSAIAELRKTKGELSVRIKQQAQAFEDLEHQIKSPIIQTHARVQAILRGELTGDRVQYNLKAIRGLCGKAKRVTGNIGLFAALIREKQIQINPSWLEYEDLVKMLIEVATDNQVIINPERNVRFEVERESFEVVIRNKVEVDHDLVDQAANTVLDNAGKYSFSGTTVRISGGLTGTGRFQISFPSKGLRIRPDEVKPCVERGWRGGEAQLTTGEGSGIGLWIVDHIMKAHGGELVIVPTTKEGLTEIKLVFPCSRV